MEASDGVVGVIWRLSALLLTGALAGCMGPGACTLSIEPGVEVEVRDAVTDDYLSVTPFGVVREGSYEDSLSVSGMTFDEPPRVTMLSGAHERPGRYTVHIEAAGYQLWDTAGVTVRDGDCHVHTVRFTVQLTPT